MILLILVMIINININDIIDILLMTKYNVCWLYYYYWMSNIITMKLWNTNINTEKI